VSKAFAWIFFWPVGSVAGICLDKRADGSIPAARNIFKTFIRFRHSYRVKPESSSSSPPRSFCPTKYSAQMVVNTPKITHPRAGSVSPSALPVPSVAMRSSTNAKAGDADRAAAPEITADLIAAVASFCSFAAWHTTGRADLRVLPLRAPAEVRRTAIAGREVRETQAVCMVLRGGDSNAAKRRCGVAEEAAVWCA